MKTLSLKLNNETFIETEKILTKILKPRNRYINEAIAFYNKHQNRKLLEELLHKESAIVAENSLKILHEFEEIGYEH